MLRSILFLIVFCLFSSRHQMSLAHDVEDVQEATAFFISKLGQINGQNEKMASLSKFILYLNGEMFSLDHNEKNFNIEKNDLILNYLHYFKEIPLDHFLPKDCAHYREKILAKPKLKDSGSYKDARISNEAHFVLQVLDQLCVESHKGEK